jgi:hypothetical protein
MKSFEKWLAEEVEITFGVQKRKTLPLLDICKKYGSK